MNMQFRFRIKPLLIYSTSWKTLIFLGIIALSLQTVSIGLSWWIQVSFSKRDADRDSLIYIQETVSNTYSEVLNQIGQWSVLDGTGEFKFSVGIIRGKALLKFSDEYYIDQGRNNSPKSEQRNDVTLVTQCSLSRLHFLPELAKRWHGPISVAVFLLNEEMQPGVQLMLMLHRCFPEIETNTTFSVVFPLSSPHSPHIFSSPKPTPCDRVLASLSRYERPNYDFSGIPYPNNLLRNVARKAVRSSFMMLLDIDILPSKDLHPRFLDYIKENNFVAGNGKRPGNEEEKTVWVVPSYEIKENTSVPDDKKSLLKLRESGMARPFYHELCWKCQKYTEYEAWEKHLDTDKKKPPKLKHLYEVLWRDPWEPFFLSKTNIPPYDERFRQYGFNRISQVCELHVAGYRFLVLDSAFVIHKGYKKTGRLHSKKDEELERNRILFRQFKANLKEKYPESSRRCY